MQQIIHIHVEAPAKPALAQPCNGCGVCCMAEPCPVGVLVSQRRHGACKALRWVQEESRYRCGLLTISQRHWWDRLWRAWMQRVISAGSGCDATLEVQNP
ncbi:MAG: hypothetical protein EOP40_10625 [Rubrivivax sp.]|nr:MAG: hypothetical protein EOP40_10625 [Rubrivivax sp.]